MRFKGNQRKGSPHLRKRWLSWTPLVNAGTSLNCIGSKAHSCYNSLQTIRLTRRGASIKPLREPRTSKRSPSSYEQQQVSLACGSSKENVTKRVKYSGISTAGSWKVLIRWI